MPETTNRSKYVPPHLRSRPSHSAPSRSREPAPESYPEVYPQPSSSTPWSARPTPSDPSTSRTPWSVNKSRLSSEPEWDGPSTRRPISPTRNGGPYSSKYVPVTNRPPAALDRGSQRPRSDRGHARSNSASVSPTLHVFGDSFVGPFKLLSDDNVRYQTFKGASAKGLNNPNSLKQVSKELVPLLNGLLAPPPYAYFPSSGRWALLIFGNVDLQINYLWQLQNKPITPRTFSDTPAGSATERNTNPADEATEPGPDDETSSDSRDVLANATETSMRGSALGPELFVQTVANAYTSWLEREIVNGPIGERLRERGVEQGPSIRKRGTSKVLVAAALPPLVEDEILPRIPEKYVERLEEDHVKAHKAMGRRSSAKPMSSQDTPGGSSRTPWSKVKDEETIQDGLSTLQVSDDTFLDIPRGRGSQDQRRTDAGSVRSSSTASTARSSMFDPATPMNGSVHTSLTIPSSPPTTDKESASSTGLPEDVPPTPLTGPDKAGKVSIQQLLQHDPPLCTLPVRIQMTNTFNSLIKSFCGLHPQIFEYIDIAPSILSGNFTPSSIGAADRSTWACPVDATNIHPLWEPTLPLWLDELKKVGVPTDGFRITEDAEETFRAYEADKRERTARQPWGKDGKKEEGKEERRIKIRDE